MASIRSLTAKLTVARDAGECGWEPPLIDGLVGGGRPSRSPLLMQAIERRVLPRLLRLHPPEKNASADASQAEAMIVAAHAAAAEPALLAQALERLLASGASADALCLHVLAPAARRLGDLWMADELDFVQVTIGVQRLQHALHRLAPMRTGRQPGNAAQIAGMQRRILVIPVPGNQHSFGVSMVARFFHNAGWNVRSDMSPTMEDLARLMRTTYFDIVGLSASCDRQIEPLSRTLRTVRQCSANPAVCTMVGGPLFAAHPELAVQLGADSTAQDGAQAPLQAEILLRERQETHKPDGFAGAAGLRVVTPGERGGSDRSDTFRNGRDDARRPRSRIDAANHPGSR